MYFELTAPDRLSMEMAYWDAQIMGLDPQALSPLTFNILENDYDLDLESEITDAIFAESNSGNIEINDQEVCNVREN